MIANGCSAMDLQDHCMKAWQMSVRNAQKYTAEAYQGLGSNYEGIDKAVLAFVLFARLEKSFLIARMERNPAAMVAACRELADRFYKMAPDETVVANMQAREESKHGLDPEEEF